MKKFAIFCTEYMENSGGIIVMHYLCHLMRQLGVEAFMFPRFANIPINFALMKNSDYTNKINKTFSVNEEVFRTRIYKTNPVFNTPVMFETPETGFNGDWVVIYPETTFGNPLGAKNVVRWILAPPFQHQEVFTVGKGDIVVPHGKGLGSFDTLGLRYLDFELSIRYWQTEIFNSSGATKRREGIAFSRRKAKSCLLDVEVENGIFIDNMSLVDIANVFRSVKKFVSYDWASLYSQYAVLCGCTSVVSLLGRAETGGLLTEEDWRLEPMKQGVGFGVDDEAWAHETAPKLLNSICGEPARNLKLTSDFIRLVAGW